MKTENLNLAYTILCDDVRIEMGNKLSLMGVFQNILVERVPVSLIKFAIVQHWRGTGDHLTEIRILSPDKTQILVSSQPTQVAVSDGGFADNISFFVNAVFPAAGTYWVQTLVDANLFDEFPLTVSEMDKNRNRTEDEAFPEILS